jgi:glycosyltransferase involved in cell wall biosynthesis
MARIGIDIRCLSDRKKTEGKEYTFNILKNLFELDKKNEYILFSNSTSAIFSDVNFFLQFKNVSVKRFKYPNKLLNLFFWYLHWPYADQLLGGVDIFFMPTVNFIALSEKTKLILTVNDLSQEIFPDEFSFKQKLGYAFINAARLGRRAKQIVVASDSTRQDIISRWKINEKKISRIYSGVADELEELNHNDPKLIAVKEKYHLPFNFIFYFGAIEPQKNIPVIVRAYDHLRQSGNQQLDKYKLVIAGDKGWKAENILRVMRSAKFNQDIIFTSCINNEDKAAVYTLASLFVNLSFFENYGLSVLEAMRCGVPVIVSNTASLPEIVDSGGLMIDPDKPNELYLAMKELLLNRDFYELMKHRAMMQAIRFSWRASARELLGIFEKTNKV